MTTIPEDEQGHLTQLARKVANASEPERQIWATRVSYALRLMRRNFPDASDSDIASYSLGISHMVAELSQMPPAILGNALEVIFTAHSLVAAKLYEIYDVGGVAPEQELPDPEPEHSEGQKDDGIVPGMYL